MPTPATAQRKRRASTSPPLPAKTEKELKRLRSEVKKFRRSLRLKVSSCRTSTRRRQRVRFRCAGWTAQNEAQADALWMMVKQLKEGLDKR